MKFSGLIKIIGIVLLLVGLFVALAVGPKVYGLQAVSKGTVVWTGEVKPDQTIRIDMTNNKPDWGDMEGKFPPGVSVDEMSAEHATGNNVGWTSTYDEKEKVRVILVTGIKQAGSEKVKLTFKWSKPGAQP